jgi:hypothetical protein
MGEIFTIAALALALETVKSQYLTTL